MLSIPETTVRDFLNKRTHKTWWATYEGREEEEFQGPNICIIDIETSLAKVYSWGLGKQFLTIDQLIEDWEILCFSAKVFGQDTTINIDSMGEYCEGYPENTYENLLGRLWDILDWADIVVAHNGKKFDIPKINAKFLEHNFIPPSPYKVLDTYQIARKIGFTSKKLDFLARVFGFEGKHDTGGIKLWIDCMAGDVEAWAKMKAYNDQDILELEKIYLELRPWDTYHPNVAVYFEDDAPRCNCCGSSNISPINGVATTNLSKFELYRCDDCGTPLRGRVNLRSKKSMQNTFMKVRN